MTTLRIRTIARLTGIREATLRAWERRHGFPRPLRSERNNYRAYTREEVENIRRVARLISEGLSVSEAIAQVKATPVQALPPGERLSERFWSAVSAGGGGAARRGGAGVRAGPGRRGGPGAREHLQAILSVGARYAESADELMALWQQARGASHRT